MRLCTGCGVAFAGATSAKWCSIKCQLLARIEVRGECWIWTGALTWGGYGRLSVKGPDGKFKVEGAHRMACVAFGVGAPAEGDDVCHTCDVRRCINPAHLFVGTRLENMADCVAKDRQVRGERNGQARLTDAAIRQIRIDARTDQAVADAFGVSRQTISKVRSGKTWKHVE